VFDHMGRLHVILDDELHQAAKVEAMMHGETLAQFTAEAMRERTDRLRKERREREREAEDG
jgi:hypothetical protein